MCTGKVLIVSDRSDSLATTSPTLRTGGLEVLEAPNCREAWQRALDEIPDLWLLDAELIADGGLELCREIKAEPSLADTCLVLSSEPGIKESEITSWREAGIDELFIRPLPPTECLSRLKTLLRLRAAEESREHTKALATRSLEEERRKSPAAVRSKPATILLIEDNDSVRTVTGRLLERLGYRVLAACRAEEAIAIAKAKGASIDMVLTDVVMPEMNGQECYERLRGIVPGLKVLFMSGHTPDTISIHGVESEGSRFIQKPFTLDALEQKVRSVLEIQLT